MPIDRGPTSQDEATALREHYTQLRAAYLTLEAEVAGLKAENERLNALWECEHATVMRLGADRDRLRGHGYVLAMRLLQSDIVRDEVEDAAIDAFKALEARHA